MKEQKYKKGKYDLKQSPLYNIRSKKQLSLLLGLPSEKELRLLLKLENPYDKFYVAKNGKRRLCEVPCLQLQYVHSRIFNLLQRIEVPDYLHSGVKQRSYVTNARAHRGVDRVVATLDIKKFYPSVSKYMVNLFFRNTMRCAVDVAAILAELTTCDDHMPTGSSLSQILAFFATKEMFDEVDENARKAGLKMTCYVDDLTLSGPILTKKWLYESVKLPIRRFGMAYHKEKSYKKGESKEITGVIVDGDSLKVCNRHQKKIFDLTARIASATDVGDINKLHRQLIGCLSAAGQIDGKVIVQKVKLDSFVACKIGSLPM